MIKKYLVIHPPKENILPMNKDKSFPSENSARDFLRQSSSMATIRWVSSKMADSLQWWGRDYTTRCTYYWLIERFLIGQLRYPNYQGTKFVIGRDEYDSDAFINGDYLP